MWENIKIIKKNHVLILNNLKKIFFFTKIILKKWFDSEKCNQFPIRALISRIRLKEENKRENDENIELNRCPGKGRFDWTPTKGAD